MNVPSYEHWFRKQDERPSYRRFADVLRLIGARDGHRRWLLKNPGHIAQLDALFLIFPDACIVQTHRDPLEAIPSLCSTLFMARSVFEGVATRKDTFGLRECDYWETALQDAERQRTRRASQFHDVDYRVLRTDPLGTVRSIYEQFGLRLSAETERRMRNWISENPSRRHGAHRYEGEGFGVSAAEIRQRFASYSERRCF